MKKLIITFSALSLVHVSFAKYKEMTREEYVQKWSETAVSQMMEHNIPASITLAQGILESASGNSELARKGNNHFGIKCHGWEGKKMYKDDDAKNECFRVYKSADLSYQDHSAFLKKYDRYKFLFTYDVTDYKSWAKGLKRAGYATNPKYPERLITIIEDLGLQEYDRLVSPDLHVEPSIIAEKSEKNESKVKAHDVLIHSNKVKYIVAKDGDTFYQISKEFGISLKQLHRYNSFGSRKDFLQKGDVVYIQPKKRRSLFKKKEIVLDKSMTIDELSQFSAVNKKSIKRLNDITNNDTVVASGEKVTLR